MNLMNGTLIPGEVLEILENGEIKAAVPGLFSEQDKESLPPIYPFFGNHANTYSQLKVGDYVWVLSFTDNNRQLHWIRKDSFKEANKELMKEQNVEVLCNREFGGGAGWATIYFSDGSGWIIREGDSKIQIRPNGSILLDGGQSKIDINNQGISLGLEGKSTHPAAYGDTLVETLEKIASTLEAIQKAAESNPYTKGIATAISINIQPIKELIPEITSPNVTLE